MTRDRIDALAAELFAAARDERPDRDVVARVEHATASDTATARSGEQPALTGDGLAAGSPRPSAHEIAREAGRGPGGHVVRLRRPWLVRGLLAAIVCAGVALLVLLPGTPDAVIISAERTQSGPASKPVTAPSAEPFVREAVARPEPASPFETLPGLDDPKATDRSLPAVAAPERETRAERAGSAPRPRAANPPAPAPTAPQRAARPDSVGAATPGEGTATPPSKPTLSKELEALKRIRQAVRNGDGRGALVMLDRYDTGEYGTSLALEANVLRIEALGSVGQRAEAESLARHFVRDNPDSPLAERASRFIERSEPAAPAPDGQP